MENEIAQLEFGKNYDELSEAQQKEVDYHLTDEIVIKKIGSYIRKQSIKNERANYEAIIDYWDARGY